MNESVWLGFIFFSSAGNLLRWNNGGGAMVEETEKERNVERERERESQMSNVFGFRDRFRM